MSYPLRLPPELDAQARERCASLGISLNALIAVALDAYLGSQRPKPPKRAAPKPPAVKPPAKPFEPYHPDPHNWRNFHNPNTWPYVDPDWTGPDIDDEHPDAAAQFEAMEKSYWETHEFPKR